jgi:hypothetical protein
LELLVQVKIRRLIIGLIRPETAVTAFAFLLPDLVDKPLWVLGVISDGRYIGHTLLLAFLVALVFSLKKRVYGLFAICGGISHLVLDIWGFMPWFYPFKSYNFPSVDFHGIVTWYNVAYTLLELALVIIVVSVVVSLVLSFHSWVRGQRRPEPTGAGQSAKSTHREQ